MAKFLKIFSIIFIVLFLGVYLFAGTIIKTPVESIGSAVLGVPVKVESIRISPFSGKVGVSGIIVGNPKGFKSKNAFKLADIDVEASIWSALSDTIVINKIEITKPVATYEWSLKGSNLGIIQSNANSVASADSGSEEPASKKEGGKKVVIENLIIKDTQVEFVAGLAKIAPKIPDIHLKDIGKKESGVTTREAAIQIIIGINDAIADVDFGNVKDLMKGGKETLDGVADKLKGLFN